MEVVFTCPLGHICEEAKDGKIYRCHWFIEVEGTTQTGDRIKESRCSIAWQPLLITEMSSTNRGQTQALESFRNETIKRQDIALSALGQRNEKIINS